MPTLGSQDGETGENGSAGSAASAQSAGSGEDWQEGWVRYQGKIYQYNSRILTFLFMGIDDMGKVTKKAGGQNGGQADGLFLLAAGDQSGYEEDFHCRDQPEHDDGDGSVRRGREF